MWLADVPDHMAHFLVTTHQLQCDQTLPLHVRGVACVTIVGSMAG